MKYLPSLNVKIGKKPPNIKIYYHKGTRQRNSYRITYNTQNKQNKKYVYLPENKMYSKLYHSTLES